MIWSDPAHRPWQGLSSGVPPGGTPDATRGGWRITPSHGWLFRSALAGKRKRVTVLFADFTGSERLPA